jgi:hypothetical protein
LLLFELQPTCSKEKVLRGVAAPEKVCHVCLLVGAVCLCFRPEALDGALLQHLPVQLQLDLPAAEAREDLLMGWLMEREAAVNVQDVEWLAR